MAANPDFSDLFSTFAAHDVRFLVVGAYAVAYHARPRFTQDLDLWTDPAPDNAERTFRALAAYGEQPIHVLSREHLLRNKRATGRPQDLLDIEALEDDAG